MSKRKNILFKSLHILAWVIFVGLCIEAGGLIVNLTFSVFNPEFIQKLYQPLDLTAMYESRKWAFFGIYSFILTISILKALLFYIVIRLMHKMDLTKPFSSFVSTQLLKISYCTIAIGLLSFTGRQIADKLVRYGLERDSLSQFWADSQAFVLMGAVIYIIAIIFKKGVDIQKENELTI
jgi:hypothetical protein